ncbi:hypothetical protein F5141DRAFT_1066637 [Pisolithus sp. B1]|nr:hypothetical protein F5141DRAFT_1066637 [Pisolithus sp. B1]
MQLECITFKITVEREYSNIAALLDRDLPVLLKEYLSAGRDKAYPSKSALPKFRLYDILMAVVLMFLFVLADLTPYMYKWTIVALAYLTTTSLLVQMYACLPNSHSMLALPATELRMLQRSQVKDQRRAANTTLCTCGCKT